MDSVKISACVLYGFDANAALLHYNTEAVRSAENAGVANMALLGEMQQHENPTVERATKQGRRRR